MAVRNPKSLRLAKNCWRLMSGPTADLLHHIIVWKVEWKLQSIVAAHYRAAIPCMQRWIRYVSYTKVATNGAIFSTGNLQECVTSNFCAREKLV